MNNIVIFGPIHSGKTTLAGYIFSHYFSEEEFNLFEDKIKRQLEEKNILYRISNRFTYFISLDEDELVKDKKTNEIGSSKRIHVKHVPHKEEDSFIDITYIETPGINTKKIWEQQYEGIFAGDIGIFVIDIYELLKLNDISENSQNYKRKIQNLFSSLFLWCSAKDKSKVVIAVSKTEECYAADIRCAVDIIRSITEFSDMRIIPIGINISERKEYNIFSNKNCIKRIQERYKTLMDEVIQIISQSRMTRKHDIRFAYINNSVNDNLVIKVLSGTFMIGEQVKIYPTKVNDFGESAETFLKISSAKSLDDDIVYNKEIDAGNIVKIDERKVKFLGKEKSLKDIIFSQSSLLLGIDTNFIEGNYILFSTKSSNSSIFQEKFKSINLMQRINIIWFGKIIKLEVISRYREKESYCLGTMIVDDSVIMPLDKNSNEYFFPYKQFTLEIDNSYFFDANLILIKNINRTQCMNCFFQAKVGNNKELIYDITNIDMFKQNLFGKEDFCYTWYEDSYEKIKKNLFILGEILNKHKVNEYEHRLQSCNNGEPLYKL